MRLSRAIPWALLLAAMCATQPASSCSCRDLGLPRLYAGADNVFSAQITGGEVVSSPGASRQVRRSTFRVIERIKGSPPFDALTTRAGGGCGLSLQVGAEYLVFAPHDGEVDACSGLMFLTGARAQRGEARLAVLREHRDHGTPLADPWSFRRTNNGCHVYALIDLATHRAPSALQLGVSGAGDATLRLQLWSAYSDHTGYPLLLEVQAQRWSVPWVAGKGSSIRRRRGAFVLEGPEVLTLTEALRQEDVNRLRVTLSGPYDGTVQTPLWTAHARGVLDEFGACVSALRAQSSAP